MLCTQFRSWTTQELPPSAQSRGSKLGVNFEAAGSHSNHYNTPSIKTRTEQLRLQFPPLILSIQASIRRIISAAFIDLAELLLSTRKPTYSRVRGREILAFDAMGDENTSFVKLGRKPVAQILCVRAIRLLGLAVVALLSLAVVADAKGGGSSSSSSSKSSSSSSSSGGYSSSYGGSGSAVNPSSSKGGYVSPGSRTSTYQYQPTYSPTYYVPPAQPRYNIYSRTRYNNNRYVSYGPAYSYNRGYGYIADRVMIITTPTDILAHGGLDLEQL